MQPTPRIDPLSDLALKSQERLFFERVPLPPDERSSASSYAAAHGTRAWPRGVEAWGFRLMQARGVFIAPRDVAETLVPDEYDPGRRDAPRSGARLRGGDRDRGLHPVVSLRYLLLRTHDWDEGVIERLREELRAPAREQDTLTHLMRQDVKP